MSKVVQQKRISIPDIRGRKGGEPIVSLTAYTTSVSRAIAPHVDFMLVGDSLGMVIYGLDSTIGVTMDMMLAHGAAVRRGAPDSCIVVDMPFGSYEESREVAFRNAARLMRETRCDAIKLEGGEHMADTIRYLVQRGIPVLAHVGLTPQSVNVFGGFKAQGHGAEAAAQILQDARAVEEAGAFAVVIEGVVEKLGKQITETLAIPTIGIGASPSCDGQILVTEDILGLFDEFKPKFVKRYAHMAKDISTAAEAYAADVRSGRFPTLDHCFGVKKGKVVAL